MSSRGSTVIQTNDGENPIAVKFTNVTKTYRLYKNDRARLLAAIWPKVKNEKVHANNNLSFTIKRGESVAFLGSNGAGKSTALKITTGVASPTSGRVEVNGRVSALLDLTSGFDSQLTGRENLMLRGRLWGLSTSEILELLPEITDFAEIGQYIDQPMRTYSSGMKARLGFAFSSSLRPEILILDEVLAVGDRRFSAKSLERMTEIMTGDKVTLLFVTHSLEKAAEFCKRALVIDHGKLLFDGPIDEGIEFYTNSTN
ncbi:MAG: ABC transporter ATP-binding protein [Propionibacteriaceae bacterium]|jgi:teichoic acid transport system ATP-binding protein|nr:ABC transporter ATP-binding protein [Propionibacteriaceae bacterium]